MSARIIVFAVLNVVFRIAVTEPVGKNLIEHRALSPIGDLKTGYERKVVFRLHVFHTAETVIANHVVLVNSDEMVINLF